MTTHRAGSYTESIETFLESAEWLTDVDVPAVTTLLLLAKRLDEEGFHAQTIAQFGLCYRALLKRAPGGDDEETDPLEALLAKKKNPNAHKGNEKKNEKNNRGQEDPDPGAAATPEGCSVLCQRTCPDVECPGLSGAWHG